MPSILTVGGSCRSLYKKVVAGAYGDYRAVMKNPIEPKEFDVADVDERRVWFAIRYLDSSTNYREYLPQQCPPKLSAGHDDFVLLTSSRRSTGWNAPLRGWLVALLLLMLVLLLYFKDEL